jgi:2-oxoglutarate dehydrogenase E1 component
MCTGKIYYELEREREQSKRSDVAIIRIEQLYPVANDTLDALLRPYRDGTPAIWVQDEPVNMGAWPFLLAWFGQSLFGRLPFSGIARPASASPATGSHSSHKKEQEKLITAAFA